MRYSERTANRPYLLEIRARQFIAEHIAWLRSGAPVDRQPVDFSRAPLAEFAKRFECWHGFRGISRTATLRSRKRLK